MLTLSIERYRWSGLPHTGVALLLGILLLLAQTGMSLHALDHDIDHTDAYCALCVGGQHLGHASISAAPVPATVAAVGVPSAAKRVQPVLLEAQPWSARAPPV